jgi:quercetin dioxygenase-like cupin family protein
MQQQSWKQHAGKLAVTFVAVSLAAAVSSAHAGECPADKRVADGQGQKMVTSGPVGVADVVRSSINLTNEAPMLKDRLFRLRTLDIAPGGVVPWHSHNERPAQIYIVKGEIVEYASTCAVPIVHRAGEVAPERNGTSHWWQNHTKEPVLLISVDILHDKAGADKKMM